METAYSAVSHKRSRLQTRLFFLLVFLLSGDLIQLALLPLFFLGADEAALILPLQGSGADDDDVAGPAQKVRDFMEVQESEKRGKQNL